MPTIDEYDYDKAIDMLIEQNGLLRSVGMCMAFSGPSLLIGNIDPNLPYGVVRNGDGRLFDVLLPAEREEHPLPSGYRRGEYRAEIVTVAEETNGK